MKVLIDGQTLATGEVRRGIGQAFIAIASRTVMNEIGTQWSIAVSHPSQLEVFDWEVRQRLRPVRVDLPPAHLGFEARARLYTDELALAMRGEGARTLWVPNPLMPNVILPQLSRCARVIATLYDLIPWVMREHYLDRWPQAVRDEYLRRLDELATHAHRLVAISKSAAADMGRYAPHAAARVVSVPLAADLDRFVPLACPLARDENGHRTILFTGGFDARKNMVRALEAFAEVRRRTMDVRFVVVCAATDADRASFLARAAELGVAGDTHLTGYVEPSELVRLVQRATVFFFPSLYEGFGLPVAEALACGTPVVALANSSIPEVGGDALLYAKDGGIDALADALRLALRPEEQAPQARARRIAQARLFSWERTALAYQRLFVDSARPSHPARARRLRIAMATPWPPQESGVATYSRALAAELERHVDLTIVSPEPEKAERAPHHVIGIEEFQARAGDFDLPVYHVGNNTKFHRRIYELAWDHPGAVVIHDTNIHSFLHDAFFGKEGERYYRDSLVLGHGDAGAKAYAALRDHGVTPDIWTLPASRGIARASLATIVHSAHGGRELAGIPGVHVIPHGAVIARGEAGDTDREMRASFGIAPDRFIVASFGFVNFLKRVPQALEAVKRLLDAGWPVQFVLAGSLVEPALGIREKIEALGIAAHVTVTGYITDAQFDAWMRLADVVVNLRFPSMGESSGSLLRALGMGKACIVSDYAQFGEFPKSVCVKVPPDQPAEIDEIARAIAQLLGSPAERAALGRRAQQYTRDHASFAYAAQRYLAVFESALAVQARKRLHRRQSPPRLAVA